MSGTAQFRIFVGSYEHNLLCLSLSLDLEGNKSPIFQPIFHFQAHSLSIRSMDLAKRYLVTGSNDEHIRIYDLQKRKELGTLLSHQGSVTSLQFSKEVFFDNDNQKSGKWLLSGSEDGVIIIWRTKDWEPFGTLKGHQGKINDIATHPSGRVAVSVSQDNTIRLWNLLTARKAAVLKVKGKDHLGRSLDFVEWTLDGRFFTVGLRDQIWIYETKNAKIFKKITFKSTLMTLDIVQANGTEYMVTGHGDGQLHFTNSIQIIQEEVDQDNGVSTIPLNPSFSLRGHTNRIKDVSLYNHTVDGKIVPYLVSVSSDGRIVVWNLRDDKRDEVAVYDSGERLNCVSTSPESVEKTSTMKHGLSESGPVDDSEYETDGEEVKNVSKRAQKKKKTKVSVTLE